MLDVCTGGPEFALSLLRGGFDGTVLSFEHRCAISQKLNRACLEFGSDRWAVYPQNSFSFASDSAADFRERAIAKDQQDQELRSASRSGPLYEKDFGAHLNLDIVIKALELHERTYLKIGSPHVTIPALQGASDSLRSSIAAVDILLIERDAENDVYEIVSYLSNLGMMVRNIRPHIIKIDAGMMACSDLIMERRDA